MAADRDREKDEIIRRLTEELMRTREVSPEGRFFEGGVAAVRGSQQMSGLAQHSRENTCLSRTGSARTLAGLARPYLCRTCASSTLRLASLLQSWACSH